VRRDTHLWLDLAPDHAGIYLLDSLAVASFSRFLEAGAEGAGKQTLLHLRKRVDGRRVLDLRRVAGERILLLEIGGLELVLQFSGRPSLTLLEGEEVLGVFGAGGPVLRPEARPEREWEAIGATVPRLEGDAVARRAILSAWPVLGPRLADWLVHGSPEELKRRLRKPAPFLLTPAPLALCHDEDLVPASALGILPAHLEFPRMVTTPAGSFREAARLFLGARLRANAFAHWRKVQLGEARRAVTRLEHLQKNLSADAQGLADPGALRRQAEALLASPSEPAPGSPEFSVPDPYAPDGPWLSVPISPLLSRPQNADRLFEKARRAERAERTIATRLRGVLEELVGAKADLERVLAATDLPESRLKKKKEKPAPRVSGPLRFLTSRGLLMRVGRGARENQALTFSVAKPEDFWLHARDVPGGHVILEDRDGRANGEDLREAAETAAFMSDARGERWVDVHVTRRKHVRPAQGGAGRVRVSHSETLRVQPRDPEGRLRSRSR
jgi:hypothetical protein